MTRFEASLPGADPGAVPSPRRGPNPASSPKAGRAAAGFALATVAGVALSADVASGPPILAGRWAILARLAAWAVAWAVAVAFALRLPRRVAVGAIFAAAIALRLGALAGPPVLSDDLYRYAWDGRVQAAGVNPYRYAPSAPELAPLREGWLWPDEAGCEELERPPGCTRLNRPAVRTIYPPLAQAWFAVVYRLAGIDAGHKAWQVAGLAGDVALVGLLPVLLRAWGRDERWTALYALSPVAVVEVVNNGHVDGMAALLVVGALLAAARRRPGWGGVLLGAAALVKLYPALLVAALAGVPGGGRRLPSVVRAAGSALAVMVAGYLPHVAGVGVRVLGYLPGYLREENYTEGGRYLLAGLLPLPDRRTAIVAAAGLVAVVAWVLVTRPAVPRAGLALMGALLLATTPVQPWYAVTLLALATVAVTPRWALVAAAGYPYFFAVILGVPRQAAMGRAAYGAAVAGMVLAALASRGRRSGATAAGTAAALTPNRPRRWGRAGAAAGATRRAGWTPRTPAP